MQASCTCKSGNMLTVAGQRRSGSLGPPISGCVGYEERLVEHGPYGDLSGLVFGRCPHENLHLQVERFQFEHCLCEDGIAFWVEQPHADAVTLRLEQGDLVKRRQDGR